MGKSMVSCKFSLKPIHWYILGFSVGEISELLQKPGSGRSERGMIQGEGKSPTAIPGGLNVRLKVKVCEMWIEFYEILWNSGLVDV